MGEKKPISQTVGFLACVLLNAFMPHPREEKRGGRGKESNSLKVFPPLSHRFEKKGGKKERGDWPIAILS